MSNSFLDEDIDCFKDFQKPSHIDPAIARIRERDEDEGNITTRARAQSFSTHRKISPTERERASSFSQLKSSKYLERVKMRKEQKLVKKILTTLMTIEIFFIALV